MPNTTSTYEPLVLVDTADLPEEEWLEYRRRGIGGSDAAAILGVSPFATARDLYYDKLKVVSYEDGESNWVQKKVGHLLEDLVAEIFHVKTGFEIYQVKKMFYHPVYTYMLADIDYFIRLPNGKTAILEIKTTNYNAKDHWWCDGQEIVPVNYEIQGRHYMCVMNMDEVYFCCLYGNNENEVIIRHIERDPDYEAEMIALEGNFWNDHVLTQTPPPYTEDGELTLESVRRHFGPADENAPEIELSVPLASSLVRYTELVQEIRGKGKERKSLLAQKKETPLYLIPKQCELSRHIAELTEELEELKSEKDMLLHSLECSDDAGIAAVKKDISTMEAALKKLSQQEEKYTAELNDALQQYADLKTQSAEFDPDELQDARLDLRPAMERSVVDRVQSAYGDKYDYLMMYDSKRDVADILHEETEARSIREHLRQKQQAQQKQNKKNSRDTWER